MGVGGLVTYQFYRLNPVTYQSTPGQRLTFRVTGIVDIPPVLVDQSDEQDGGVLPPGATRATAALLRVLLGGGPAGPRDRRDTGPCSTTSPPWPRPSQRRYFAATHQKENGLTFAVARQDIVRSEVRQAIGPQVVALAVFGAIAALAMLVLAGQALAQLMSRSAQDISVLRALGGSRAQTALAASLPGVAAILGATILAVAGAIALSPLAPVGQVRQFDPARGVQADGLVLGAGSALLAAILLAALAVMGARATRQVTRPDRERPSAVAHAAAAAGLPAPAVVASRNALEPGSGPQAVPVRATLLGSIAAVTAVVAAAVFGASLTGLVSHPARYGWNWQILIRPRAGTGNSPPA